MHNELTKVDIEKMQQEIDYRMTVVRPKILEEVKFARSHGDLSENAEYHAAKRERGKNESRIRFLKNMIKTAVVVDDSSSDGEVGLFDTVTLYIEEDDIEEVVRLATTMRQDALQNIVSKESPIGKAIFGKKLGERVYIELGKDDGYFAVIRSIEKGSDDESLTLRAY